MHWIPLSPWHGSAQMLSIDGERPRPAFAPLTTADCAGLAGVSIVAFALRLFQLDRSELWFDEAFAALVAMEPTRALVSELAADSSPPLYFLLLRAWLLVLGADVWTLRLLSVACGLIAVWATFLAGYQLWGSRAGLAGAALLAVSPLHIYYSREVRPYALLIVLALVSIVALEAMGRGRPGSPTVYGVATIAAIWTHNYGLLLLLVLGLWVLMRLVPVATAVKTGLIVAAGCLPWLPVLVTQVTSGAMQWVERLWIATPPAQALLLSLAGFTIGGRTPAYVPTGSDALPWWLQSVAYGLFAFLVLSALVRERVGSARRIALLGIVPLGAPIALSFVMPVFLVGRHDVIVLPLFLLLAGRGVSLIGARRALAAWLMVVVCAGVAVHRYHKLPAENTTRRQAAVLLEHARPGDAALATGFTRNGVEFAVRERGGTMPFRSFPTSFSAHRGWVDERELGDAAFLRDDAARLTATLRATVGDDGLLWIVHSRDLAPANALLMRSVDQSFRQAPCPGAAEDNGMTCWRRRLP